VAQIWRKRGRDRLEEKRSWKKRQAGGIEELEERLEEEKRSGSARRKIWRKRRRRVCRASTQICKKKRSVNA
jgi:hypothetical protein